MALRNLLSAERIAILVESGNRDAVLDTAARLLATPASARPNANPSPVLLRTIGVGLREREQLASTAIGHGMAIPHARVAGIDEGRCAFIRLVHPVDFHAADGKPIDLVLALAVPEHQVQEHLELLADLAARFSDPGYRAELRAAPTIDMLRRRLLDDDQCP